MKVCPNCQTKYPDDANFCPQENCATSAGPRRLEAVPETVARPRYELEAQLGGSRSGEVWRARDSQTGTVVAYKRVARGALPTPATFERALRELKQLQRAQGPRLARVLDFGREPDGGLFVVTELAGGQPLDRLVAASGALTVDRAKKIISQIGEALLEGQKVGVVHHDLSPKNVLVAEGDEVKVINFVAPVPVTETVFGVPEYLSPEQAEGKLVDQRSNTYSLGAIMTLLLSGRAPVEGPDVASILGAVGRGEIAPPSRLMAGLTPEIDRVVLKAMDKSPNRRPLTLRQFLTEVNTLVAPNAAVPDRGGVGFAKTMMFAGGAPEIQRLVNEARTARAGAGTNGASTPPASTQDVVAVPAAQHTPPPQAPNGTPAPQPGQPSSPVVAPRRPHGAAVAATMVALPAASPRMPAQSAAPASPPESDPGAMTPPPVAQATPAPVVGGPSMAPTPKPAAGGTFRETLWFKKGDVDQMVAEARARVEAAREKSVAPPPEVVAVAAAPTAPEDGRPLEERYVDDGTVTAEDRKKFSLRTAGTSAALPTLEPVPGERMSEEEMASEIGGGRRVGIIVVAVLVALGICVTVALAFRHKGGESAPSSVAPTEAPPAAPSAAAPPAPPAPEAAPTPPPPPAPAPAAAAAPKPIAAKAQVDADDDEPAAAAPKPHPSTHRHASAKKAKPAKKHH